MSATLLWKPAPPPKSGKSLPSSLRFILAKKYDLSGSDVAVLSSSDIPYLEGLRDAGIAGAYRLIGYIQKHSAIEIWLEH